jgi:hypothetical protein
MNLPPLKTRQPFEVTAGALVISGCCAIRVPEGTCGNVALVFYILPDRTRILVKSGRYLKKTYPLIHKNEDHPMENCGICGASKAQIMGMIGAVLLIIGCFVPLFSVTVLGKTLSVTFVSAGFYIYGGALILTSLVIIGLLFAKKIKEAQGAGLAVFLTILVFFVDAITGYTAIKDMGFIASFAAGFFSFGYAWIVLFAGSILVIAVPFVDRLSPAK